jgi:fructokinase
MGIRLGIDFGGTKTETIALDSSYGKELYRKCIPTPRDDYQATLKSFTDLMAEVETTLGGQGIVGMGIPGAVS